MSPDMKVLGCENSQQGWHKQGQEPQVGGPILARQWPNVCLCFGKFQVCPCIFCNLAHAPSVSWMESLLLPEPEVREVRHSRWLAVCFCVKAGVPSHFLEPPLASPTPRPHPYLWSLLSLALSSTPPSLSTLFIKNTNMVSASITWNYRGCCLWCPCSPRGNSSSQQLSAQLLHILVAPKLSS